MLLVREEGTALPAPRDFGIMSAPKKEDAMGNRDKQGKEPKKPKQPKKPVPKT